MNEFLDKSEKERDAVGLNEGGTLIGILLIDLPAATSFMSVAGTEDFKDVYLEQLTHLVIPIIKCLRH